MIDNACPYISDYRWYSTNSNVRNNYSKIKSIFFFFQSVCYKPNATNGQSVVFRRSSNDFIKPDDQWHRSTFESIDLKIGTTFIRVCRKKNKNDFFINFWNVIAWLFCNLVLWIRKKNTVHILSSRVGLNVCNK